MLKDGKIVESNLSEKPYKFKLGNIFANPHLCTRYIRGWDVGIRGNYLSA